GVSLVGRQKYGETWRLVIGHGRHDNFHLADVHPSLVLPLGRKARLAHIDGLRLSQVLDAQILTYTETDADSDNQLRVALYDPADEMQIWDVMAADPRLRGRGMVVPEYSHTGQYVLYYGQKDINVAFSKNLSAWHTGSRVLAAARAHHFDNHALKVVAVGYVSAGIMLLYETHEERAGKLKIHVGALLLDPAEPDRVSWRSDEPLYTYEGKTKDDARVLGAAIFDDQLIVYLSTSHDKLIAAQIGNPFAPQTVKPRDLQLARHRQNPIMSPGGFEWESRAVLNPAAFVDNGRVHLLYRAMGPDGVSRIGYASSADGIHFDERLPYPVYTPSIGFGLPEPNADKTSWKYDPTRYPSGGGWAGCEDPRAVCIEGRLYMSFCAFNGWDFMRQALTSIDLSHVQSKRWHWQPPKLISQPGTTQKNWVIFPEKINGRYAILHGLSPKIHIEYVDSLDDLSEHNHIKSLPPAGGGGFRDPTRAKHWDSRVRGAGAPPLRTPMGWLLLYHATDQRDPGKYKLGAMLLDLDDPTKILYRSNAPILGPEAWYENDGKPGVVYTCGAVILGENLIVYYGAGDKHIAVARTNVEEFVNALIHNHNLSLAPVAVSEMGIS
ncbi:MAG TPA: hypothetical protein VI322_00470, partial [Candidatus Saccharimonadia bacterium]